MAVIYNPNVVQDKLVFCVDAGNIKSYSGSGTNFYDLLGNLDGTMTSVTVTGDGHFSFNGANPGSAVAFPDSLVAKDPSSFLGGDPGKLTYECWINKQGENSFDVGTPARIMSTDASDYTAITMYNSAHSSYPNQIIFYADGNSTGTQGATSQLRSGSSNQILVNEWNHIVCTFDRSQTTNTQKIYMNGNEVASKNYTDANSTYGDGTSKSFAIGSNTEASVSYNNGFKGYIDICRIYGKALSAAEVKQNFEANRQRFGV